MPKKFMHFKKLLSVFLIGASFLAIIAVGVFWNNLNEAKGAPSSAPSGSVAVTGYAWSSNIGWIQFNPSYGGVFYSTSTGQLSGYAWSSNIGWIYFGPNPTNGASVSGRTPANWAKVDSPANTTSSNVSGWAITCAGMVPGDCSTNVSRTDGWDGWIKMSGSWSSGVSLNLNSSDAKYGEFSGYAWGSEVVGWVSFNCLQGGVNTCGTSDYKVKVNLSGVLSVTCSASPNPVELNTSTTFTATVTGGTPNYTYVWSGDVPSKTTTNKSGLTDTNNQSYSSIGTKNATIKVTDSGSPQQSDTKTCSVEVKDTVPPVVCPPNCGGAICGNSSLESGETCDDGNTASGDGCSSVCQDEVSGSVCGNSAVESGETCDDGNTASGDGCSSVCQTESGGSSFTLTVNASGNGEVEVKQGGSTSFTCSKVTCSKSYSSGASLTLTATADSGASFNGWSDNGCSGTGDCSITMNGDKTVNASFTPDTGCIGGCGGSSSSSPGGGYPPPGGIVVPPPVSPGGSSSSSPGDGVPSSSLSSRPSVIIHEI